MGLLDFLSGSGSGANGGLLDYLSSLGLGQAQPQPGQPSQWPPMGQAPAWLPQTISGLQNGPSGFTPPPPPFQNMGAAFGQSPLGGSPPQGDRLPSPSPDASAGFYGGSPANNPLLNPLGAPAPQQAMDQSPAPSPSPSVPSFGGGMSGAADVAGGVGNRLLNAMNGFANGGSPLGAVANAITTLATGRPTDPQSAANERVTQTYKALIATGLPEPQARAAALNPEVLKILAPEMMPKFGVVGKDIAGNEQYGFSNPLRRTVTPATVEGAPGGGLGIGFPTDAAGNPLQGPQILDHLKRTDPAAAAEVVAIIRGDAAVTGRNLQKYMPIAQLVDPTVSQFNYDARKKTALDFAPSGKSAVNVKGLETVGGHIDKLIDNFEKLGNTWQPEFNSVKNWFAVRLGKGAVNGYETTVNGVANELGTVFRSYGMSDAEVKSWRDRMATANSPQQFTDGMATLLDMLKTRKEALIEQYKQGLGKDPPPEMFGKLDAAITRIQSKISPPDAGAAKPAATMAPPPAAVEALRKNPRLSEDFDAKYGDGTAARLLGVMK